MNASFDKRTTPARADLAAEFLRGKIGAPRYSAGRILRVAAEAAPLSSAPSRDAPIDTQALHGEAVTVYDVNEEGWAWCQLQGDSYVGYLRSDSLADMPMPTHRVTAARTFVYPSANMKTPISGALPLGGQIAVRAANENFVELAAGGFVWAAHVAPLDAFESDFTAVAERFLHVPYLWGGKTFSGLDCSGLVQISLAACGISAPRDTDMMAGALGEAFEIGEGLEGLQRGDLIFWKGHIGIMQDGARLLHANGHHMRVASEPLAEARDRIREKSYGAVTCVKRLRRIGA